MSNGNSTTQPIVRQIPLTQGKVALVDEEDYEMVSQFKWYAHLAHNIWYARRSVHTPRQFAIRLHRFILDAPSDMQVDHINGDGLDNRRANLRLCTETENNRNARKKPGSSRFKGVHWHKASCKWCAAIQVNLRRLHLGLFDSEEAAHRAYCEASAKYHGKFGRTA